MEVLKLNIVGSYSYKSDIDIISYKSSDNKYSKECVICKKSLLEPSYEMVSDNKNILNEPELVIGKCGHIFHGDCLGRWLKTCQTCPIDKVKWCLHRVADTTTNLVIYEPSYQVTKLKKNITNGDKKKYTNKR